jgi:FixJ family two-component response regulator
MSEQVEFKGDAPTVSIIDNDESARKYLVDLLSSHDIEADGYECPGDFLANIGVDRHGCILLDVDMPDLNGLQFQLRLRALGCRQPLVLITSLDDVRVSVDALNAGATDFLFKPLESTDVMAATMRAVREDGFRRSLQQHADEAYQNAQLLTPREREVMKLVTDGLLNKQIAFEMGISEIMAKLHRGRMMRKMRCRSLSELVRQYDLLVSRSVPVLDKAAC